jgi:hypothetical protein
MFSLFNGLRRIQMAGRSVVEAKFGLLEKERKVGFWNAVVSAEIITVWTLPPCLRMPKTGILPAAPRPRLPLGTPPKSLSSTSTDRQAILQLPRDDLTQPMKEIGGRLAVDAGQIRRAPRRHAPTKNSANRSCVVSFRRQPLFRVL